MINNIPPHKVQVSNTSKRYYIEFDLPSIDIEQIKIQMANTIGNRFAIEQVL